MFPWLQIREEIFNICESREHRQRGRPILEQCLKDYHPDSEEKEEQRFTREAGDVYEHQRPAKATVDEYMLFDLGKQRAEYKSGLEHLQGKAMYASIIGQPKPTLDEYTNDVRAHSP